MTIIKVAAKMQTTSTNEAVYYLLSVRDKSGKHHVMIYPCCSSVMKPNVNPATLISKKDIARIAKTVE